MALLLVGACGVSAAPADIPLAFTLAGGLQGQAFHSNLIALPAGAAPAGGFTPLVIVGLTNEKSFDDLDWSAAPSPGLGGITLPHDTSVPGGTVPHYAIALFDTGAQVNMLTDADTTLFNLGSVGRQGNQIFTIGGAAGQEDGIVSDPLGLYATGFGAITGTAPLAVDTGTFQGQTNVALLSVHSTSLLPNVVGAPMAMQYAVVMRNSTTYKVTVDGTTYRTPQVQLLAPSTTLPATTYHAPLQVAPGLLGSVPSFFPSFDNFDDFADNPAWPTISGSFFLSVDVAHTGGHVDNQSFFFDTGADISVISKLTASNLGIFVDAPGFVPDFSEDVIGAGGTLHNVPGMYIQSLNIDNSTGPLTMTNVAVLILNLPDGSGGTLPGLVGTNVLSDRDIVINTDPNDPYLGISDALSARWAVDASGNWSAATNWILGAPDDVGAPANFMNTLSADRTVTVDGSGYTVGKIHFEGSHHYLIDGPGTLTMQVASGNARIESALGSHTIAAEITLQSNVDVDVTGGAGLTLSGNLTNNFGGAGTTITKTGAGLLTISGPQTHGPGAALAVQGGTLAMNSDAGSAAPGGATLTISTSGAGTHVNFGAPEHLAGLTVGAGSTASLLTGGSNTLRTPQLTLAGGNNAWTSTLDVNDNTVIIDNASTAAANATYTRTINQIVQASHFDPNAFGGNGGYLWDQPGITSSTTDTAQNVDGRSVMLGVLNNDDGAGHAAFYGAGTDNPLFAGQTPGASSVLVKYTYMGDANLDGLVDGNDFAQWRFAVLHPTATAGGWMNGDFNYDGLVDGNDYSLWRFNFLHPGAPLAPAPGAAAGSNGPTAVPEPASLALLGLAGMVLLLRRKKG